MLRCNYTIHNNPAKISIAWPSVNVCINVEKIATPCVCGNKLGLKAKLRLVVYYLADWGGIAGDAWMGIP